jgi:adenosylmethionine---8-amino-7-oxononanoate aminotransferase
VSSLLNFDQQHVWHPFTQVKTAGEPLPIVRAKDATLYAEDGKTYLDANSSWWVNIHGHGNEYIKQALIEQFDQIDQVIFAGVTHPKAVELATRIVQLLPEKLEKVFFSDDGSTAIEVALKMAFQFWSNEGNPRKRILALEGAYHGDTFGAMSVSQRGVFNQPFEHLFFEVDYLDFPATLELEKHLLEEAEAKFKTNQFAAFIVEPIVQGSAGMKMYRPAFLENLSFLAQKYDVLVIFDEIMTGWGRTGRLFAMNYTTVEPDIVCLSKGLTGGVLPLGLTIASNKIYNAFLSDDKTKALLHGHSFTANPLACAVACANLDLIEEPSFFENIERISRSHLEFNKRIKIHPKLKDVRQVGTIIAFEIQDDNTSSYFSNIRDKAYDYFLSKGILLRPLGNVIFINPPYCITNEELKKIYDAIESFLNELKQNGY